jgi:hypothetical protein
MTKQDRNITVRCGETLTIELESNPTTGYGWHPVFDETYLKLIANEFIPTTSSNVRPKDMSSSRSIPAIPGSARSASAEA